MLKKLFQLFLFILIIGTINTIKKGNLKYSLESYILSIITYSIIFYCLI